MAKKSLFAASKADLNMTPMIDVTFQLIIFFLLSIQTASDEIDTRVSLSRPHESRALKDEAIFRPGNRVFVSAVAEDAVQNPTPTYLKGQVAYYMIRMPAGKKEVRREQAGDLADMILSRRLASKDAGRPETEFTLILRADKRMRWSEVEPVIQAGIKAEVPKMNITAYTKIGE